MIAFFRELFHYDNACNQRLNALLQQHRGQLTERSGSLYSHILNAHHIWNARLLSKKPAYAVWQVHPMETYEMIQLENYTTSQLILDRVDLTAVMDYTNSTGQCFSNVSSDVLFHVINHGTYHRGQIAADLRQSGIEPINTDYIFYKR